MERSLVYVEGTDGVGKTTLVRLLSSRAAAAGIRIVDSSIFSGDAFDQTVYQELQDDGVYGSFKRARMTLRAARLYRRIDRLMSTQFDVAVLDRAFGTFLVKCRADAVSHSELEAFITDLTDPISSWNATCVLLTAERAELARRLAMRPAFSPQEECLDQLIRNQESFLAMRRNLPHTHRCITLDTSSLTPSAVMAEVSNQVDGLKKLVPSPSAHDGAA